VPVVGGPLARGGENGGENGERGPASFQSSMATWAIAATTTTAHKNRVPARLRNAGGCSASSAIALEDEAGRPGRDTDGEDQVAGLDRSGDQRWPVTAWISLSMIFWNGTSS
jgi:hypothetical protein